ncbi:unnamed protein product [Prunus brigantina]
MYDTTNQIGEDMPIGLGGSFEYQGAIRRVRGGEAEGTDHSGEDSARENQRGVTVAVAGRGVRLPLSPFLQSWMSRLGIAPHQMNPNVYRTMKFVPSRLLLPSECSGEDDRKQSLFLEDMEAILVLCVGLTWVAIFVVELERADMSAAEQEQVNQVLAVPGTERAADILLASEGLISLTNEPSRNDHNMQARLMEMAKKGWSGGSARGLQLAR